MAQKLKIVCINDQLLPCRETDAEQITLMLSALGKITADVSFLLPRKWLKRGQASCQIADYYDVDNSFDVRTLASVFPSCRGIEKPAHGFVSLFATEFKKADVIYTRNLPTVFLALQLRKKPVVYETFRVWSNHAKILQPFMRWMLKHKRLLGVVTHSTLSGEDLLQMGLPTKKLLVAFNGYDPKRMKPVLDKYEARKKLSLPMNAPIVTYTGHVNMEKGLGIMLDMARKIPHVHFVIVGSYGEGEVETLANSIPNVHIIAWKPFKEVIPYLYASDVLFIPPARGPLETVGNTVLPIKTFLYMASGRPILGPRSEDLQEILRHDKNAVLVEPDNLSDACTALCDLLSNQEKRDALGKQAAQDVEGLTYQNRATRFINFVNERLTCHRIVPTQRA